MNDRLKAILDKLEADQLTSVVREFFTEEQLRECLINMLSESDKEDLLLSYDEAER